MYTVKSSRRREASWNPPSARWTWRRWRLSSLVFTGRPEEAVRWIHAISLWDPSVWSTTEMPLEQTLFRSLSFGQNTSLTQSTIETVVQLVYQKTWPLVIDRRLVRVGHSSGSDIATVINPMIQSGAYIYKYLIEEQNISIWMLKKTTFRF